MKYSILLSILFLSTLTFAQKKKGKYDDYWAEQAKLEQFNKLSENGHTFFKQGDLEDALKAYEQALEIKPEDQKTIAKINDIRILMQQQKASPPEKTEIKEQSTNVETAPLDSRLESSKTNSTPTKEKDAPKQITSNTSSVVKKESEQPYKNLDNYRRWLAVEYKEGWTEEVNKEKSKETIKRVFVKDGVGDEYLMVKHHYGAIFYFKNGVSISYGTYVAETKSFKKPE